MVPSLFVLETLGTLKVVCKWCKYELIWYKRCQHFFDINPGMAFCFIYSCTFLYLQEFQDIKKCSYYLNTFLKQFLLNQSYYVAALRGYGDLMGFLSLKNSLARQLSKSAKNKNFKFTSIFKTYEYCLFY